jgi:hypothetical protein
VAWVPLLHHAIAGRRCRDAERDGHRSRDSSRGGSVGPVGGGGVHGGVVQGQHMAQAGHGGVIGRGLARGLGGGGGGMMRGEKRRGRYLHAEVMGEVQRIATLAEPRVAHRVGGGRGQSRGRRLTATAHTAHVLEQGELCLLLHLEHALLRRLQLMDPATGGSRIRVRFH